MITSILARVLTAGLALSVLAAEHSFGQSALAEPAPQMQPRQRERGAARQPGQVPSEARAPRQGAGGVGGFGRMGEPGVNESDLKTYADILNLDKNQMDAAKLLLEAHRQELADHQAAARDKMDTMRREAREAQDPAAFGKMATQMQSLRAERAKMETQFLDDLKATLTPEQAAKWPVVEQTRRREKTMSRGLLAGERLDIIRNVERLKLDEKSLAEIKPVLDQYAADLDRELAARNQVTEAAQGNAAELMANMDMAKITKAWEEVRTASMRVRDINRRYARQIEPMIPEASRTEFAEATRRESYPLIYRPNDATRAFDAANKLSDLTDEQRTTIKTLREGYDREFGALNKQMETAYDQREASIKPEELVGAMFGGRGGDRAGRGGIMRLLDTEQLSELRDQRRTVERATVDKIEAVLTPEQKAKLKARDDRDADNAGRPRNNGNENGNPPRRAPRRPASQES